MTTCPSRSSPSGKVCECNSPFTSDGTNCVCGGTDVVNLNGDGCLSTCPARSTEVAGQCDCNYSFMKNSYGTMCICATGFLDPDGNYCMAACPAGATDIGEGVCQCDNPNVSGDDCSVCNGVYSMDGATCIATCPPRTYTSSGQCICLGDYDLSPNQDACVCSGSDLVDTDGTICVSVCSAGASDNGEGICECPNGYSGANCDVCSTGILGVDGATCVTSCPDYSTMTGAGNCMCDGSLMQNGNACVCFSGDFINVDKASCVSECPDRSSDNNGVCECDSPFVENGGTCGCADNDCISLDGSNCIAICPSDSSSVSGQCVCDYGYFPNGNTCSTSCPPDYAINLDGSACIHPCPDHSSIDSGNQCVCDAPFQTSGDGQSCVCLAPDDKITVDGSSCIDSCPEYSSVVSGQCVCDDTFVVGGQDCVCDSGQYLSLSGDTCVGFCPQGSTAINGQCQCSSPFARSGDSCVCPTPGDKINVDVSGCVSTCPVRSYESGGQCFCNAAFQLNGDTCGCSTGLVVNLAGTGCISGCPAYSSQTNGACECYPGFTVSGDGNSCECSDYISVDGFSCASTCSTYASAVGTQCACDESFVQNGNECVCDIDKVMNRNADYCIDSCPLGSYASYGQCQCYPDFVGNGNACECPNSLHLSLDELNCVTPCPDHTTVVNNACICDSASNFIISSDKQSCECKPGTIFDSSSNTCLASCDSSCKTCSGPNSNECLTCYSGYQLSETNTCKAVTKTTATKSATSVEVAKATKTMSSASIAASSVASVGNSGAIRVSLVGNMFQYLKFLNISYSEELVDMLENLSSQFLPWNIDVGIPHSMTDENNYKTLPYQLTKYEEIHPSFLVNFWDDLSILIIVIGVVGVLVGLQFMVNRFYQKKTLWKFVFSKASLMAQSFLLTFTYNDLGNIIFFGLLDFKSAKKYSGVHVLNLIIAISLLLTEIGILTLHYTLLMKYRRIKRARLNPNRAKEIEAFLEKHENLKAFFEDFNDFSFVQQCFLLVAIFRDMLCNLVLVTLYQYPLAESTCFMAFSLLMIVYILYSGPFKDILNAIQQILCEGILLLVNTSVFINAVLDHIDSNDYDLRKKLGSIVVISNTVFNFIPMAFLAIALWHFLKELYAYFKGWMNKRKVLRSMKKEELSLKSDASNSSKVMLRDLSLEGPIRSSFTGVMEENKNVLASVMQHNLSEDLEVTSQDQTMSLELKVMSKNNSGIFEVKLDGDQGQDELIIDNMKEKGSYWSNKNGIRKVKIKRRMFPSPQQNVLGAGDIVDDFKLEGNEVFN